MQGEDDKFSCTLCPENRAAYPSQVSAHVKNHGKKDPFSNDIMIKIKRKRAVFQYDWLEHPDFCLWIEDVKTSRYKLGCKIFGKHYIGGQSTVRKHSDKHHPTLKAPIDTLPEVSFITKKSYFRFKCSINFKNRILMELVLSFHYLNSKI